MSATTTALPRWDLSVAFPGLDSPEFARRFEETIAGVEAMVALFDQFGVGARASAGVDEATVRALEAVIDHWNEVRREVEVVSSYLYGLVTADSFDDVAQGRMSEFQQRALPLGLLEARFVAWIGSLDVDELLARSAVARKYAFKLRRAARQAERQMSPAEEALAIELHLSGGNAWTKLYDDVSSRLTAEVEVDGEARHLPMSEIRTLAEHADRGARARAYEAELTAWEAAAVPLAAALNSIKGETITLARRRGWESPLAAALFANVIDRSTLEAMLAAARELFPDFRRYLRAKARLIGVERLAWFDLFAPVGVEARIWSYEEGEAFIAEQFGSYSPELRRLAERAFAGRWIDAEPRAGKIGGAYCMEFVGDESRILGNFSPTIAWVNTLAHELGHAYHNQRLARRPMLLRGNPSTLAETASTFCETIVRQAALARAEPGEALAILESSLVEACQYVVETTCRYLFEERLFAARRERELSVEELCELMREAQLETYDDALDGDRLHAFMWAAKSHYYSVEEPYYNFPYMFGMFFGVGLHARYRAGEDDFLARYDDLLASTGMADAPTLAERFGIDVRSIDFWRESLAMSRAEIDRFVAVVDSRESVVESRRSAVGSR